MDDTLLKMNRQTGEFQAYYSKSSTWRWHTYLTNVRAIVIVSVLSVVIMLLGYLAAVTPGFDGARFTLACAAATGLYLSYIAISLIEGVYRKEVPVEPKHLLDSSVNPYFVMPLPIEKKRSRTCFYIEDKDNAYVLATRTPDYTPFAGHEMQEGKRYLVVDGNIKMIDFEFCSKTSSEIAEIIVDKHPVFMNNSIESVRKRNKLYKAMMTEICS